LRVASRVVGLALLLFQEDISDEPPICRSNSFGREQAHEDARPAFGMYAIPRKGLLRDGRGRGLCKPMGREVVKMNGNVRGWMSSLEPLVKEWMN
jgi:hypothetical protein